MSISAESIHKVIKEKALRSVLRVSLDRYEFESEAGDVHARLDTWPTVIKESGGKWNFEDTINSRRRKKMEQRYPRYSHQRQRKGDASLALVKNHDVEK